MRAQRPSVQQLGSCLHRLTCTPCGSGRGTRHRLALMTVAAAGCCSLRIMLRRGDDIDRVAAVSDVPHALLELMSGQLSGTDSDRGSTTEELRPGRRIRRASQRFIAVVAIEIAALTGRFPGNPRSTVINWRSAGSGWCPRRSGDLAVAHHALDRIVVHVTVAAEELNGLGNDRPAVDGRARRSGCPPGLNPRRWSARGT